MSNQPNRQTLQDQLSHHDSLFVIHYSLFTIHCSMPNSGGKWLSGPKPEPRPGAVRIASTTYFLATGTAWRSEYPIASRQASAELSVQPVPCVFVEGIFLAL